MPEYVYAERAKRFPAGTPLVHTFMGNDTVFVYPPGDPSHPMDLPEKDILCKLEFQAGPIPEYGVNGLTNEILIAILVERIGRLNKMFPCRENSLAITKLEEANHWLHARTDRRVAEGIEGKHEERP